MPKYRIRLVYRPGEEKDDILEQIAELDASFFPGCKKEPLNENYWWFVYDEKDKVVGYAGMRYLEDESFGYFTRAGILEKHRGQGLHKRLIATRSNMARRLGGEGVITYVAPHNNASVNALVSRGFRLYTPERKWVGDDFLYLIKSF